MRRASEPRNWSRVARCQTQTGRQMMKSSPVVEAFTIEPTCTKCPPWARSHHKCHVQKGPVNLMSKMASIIHVWTRDPWSSVNTKCLKPSKGSMVTNCPIQRHEQQFLVVNDDGLRDIAAIWYTWNIHNKLRNQSDNNDRLRTCSTSICI